jgi:hypothetical protein
VTHGSGRWWVCVCGRKLYEHSRVGDTYVCRVDEVEDERGWVRRVIVPFRSETAPQLTYDPENGLVSGV